MDAYILDQGDIPEDDITSTEQLRQIITKFGLYAEIEDRRTFAKVKVVANMGGSMYMANGGKELDWLRRKATKIEPKSAYTIYYFKFPSP